ncbi:MAG: DNA-3-methyladenine glycosylase I [Erysipelotrichia bacterium]|nr:DNA-3-methyladenine glycosylase I [Erysipelotrichia bacterium]
MNRCRWCNLNNPLYIDYHDNQWGKLNLDEHYLYEMLILETFQAGLSWECVLNKREAFQKAFDNFAIEKIMLYDDKKITELLNNAGIIRNRLKIKAAVTNSIIFAQISKKYGSFGEYLKSFSGNKVIYEIGKTTNKLSDDISADMRKRGMKFVGSTIVYSYLQAIGLIYSHEKDCFLYKMHGLNEERGNL